MSAQDFNVRVSIEIFFDNIRDRLWEQFTKVPRRDFPLDVDRVNLPGIILKPCHVPHVMRVVEQSIQHPIGPDRNTGVSDHAEITVALFRRSREPGRNIIHGQALLLAGPIEPHLGLTVFVDALGLRTGMKP